METVEIERAVRKMLDDSDTWLHFALACRAAFSWQGSVESALTNVSHWLRADGRRRLPAAVLPIAIMVTRLDYVTPLLQLELLAAKTRKEPPHEARESVRPSRSRP